MDKLAALRGLMKAKNMDAYMINSADDHQSEYVTGYWRGRAWLSGFDGSNGLAVVTQSEAALWTDGRYFIQAEKQLYDGFTLMKQDEPGVLKYTDWLAEKLPQGGRLGFDGRAFSAYECEMLEKALKHKQIKLCYEEDLLESIWADRPARTNNTPAFEHALRFAGKTSCEKLAEVRANMRAKNADAYLTCALDSIAWLANIRGRDVPQTPVVYAFALITEDGAQLFADKSKLEAPEFFQLHPYGDVLNAVKALPANATLLYDPKTVNITLFNAIACGKEKLETDIIAELKAVKNAVEIKNTRRAHIKEGVVMARMLKWLEETRPIMETDIHEKLTALREQQEYYIEPSFSTIAAYMANAASMHYAPKPGACAEIKREGFLLVDTGGQYLDGTTDITRTIVMGEISAEMKRDFTLVLKGHIALASAQFMKGATGGHLDVLARMPLWAAGMNYRSGTGHGIGFCLGVHEGPHSISPRPNNVKLEPGMLVTNEPGVYKDGRYGIRIENMLLVTERFTNEDGTFLGFETISYCPIDAEAVDVTLLDEKELAWLNDYHQTVYEKLAPELTEAERVWLRGKTAAITPN